MDEELEGPSKDTREKVKIQDGKGFNKVLTNGGRGQKRTPGIHTGSEGLPPYTHSSVEDEIGTLVGVQSEAQR